MNTTIITNATQCIIKTDDVEQPIQSYRLNPIVNSIGYYPSCNKHKSNKKL